MNQEVEVPAIAGNLDLRESISRIRAEGLDVDDDN